MFPSACRRLSLTLGAALALVTVSRLHAEPPPPPVVPIDARGFTASQALQEAYVRSLQRKAATKTAPAPVEKRSAEAAATLPKTAVVVASSPPGGTPPGTLRPRTAETVATAPAASTPSLAARVRSYFQGKSSGAAPPPAAFMGAR